MKVCTAVTKDTTATPANTRVTPERAPPPDPLNDAPTTYVTATVTIDARNAAATTGSTGHDAVTPRPTVSAIVAPSPAPAAAPSRYGSTNGLRNTPW